MNAPTALGRAMQSWGDLPDWITVLAKACDVSSQAKIAKRLGYSAATISYVLKHAYAGDVSKVEQAVRGALMGEVVDCPVVGPLSADGCLAHQREEYHPINPQRIAFHRACRSGCPNSKLPKEY